MKKLIILLIYFFAITTFGNAQTTKTVGGSGANYATLKIAFDAINTGNITGAITLQITGNTTEATSAVLNASGTGSANYTSINLYPTTTGITMTGTMNNHFIDLNGADNVTIDGRVNATGTTKDLTITNNSTGTSATTFRFLNSAEDNIIKYCNIKGAETNPTRGILFFSTSTAGNGNDNNLIDNNNIVSDASGRPINAIFSTGTAGRENSGVAISNNNIYNVWRTASSSYSIQLAGYTTAWTISGNSFYETSTLVPTGNFTYNPIRISNASGNGFVVSDNFIGGSAAQCGGSAFTVNAATTHLFQAIYINVGTTTATSVQNNTIQNFSYSGTNVSPWQGINVTAGLVNIGNVTGNTIGASTGTGSITIEGRVNNSNTYGIYISGTGNVNCENNSIGSITTSNSNSTNSTNFYGIYKTNTSGTTTINRNFLGSNSTANSIQTASTSTATNQILIGFYSAGTGISIISNNTLANMTNSSTYYEASFTTYTTSGIATFGGSNSVTGNLIHHIACNNFINIGVLQQSKTANKNQTISDNTIYELSNNHLTGIGWVYGIYYDGPTSGTNVINRNYIHSLNVSSSNNSSAIDGIDLISGLVTCSNNIINLGFGNTKTYSIVGIWEYGVSGQSNSVYFNTIYISGNPSGATVDTYAYFKSSNSGTTNLRNNIFFNARSGGSGGKHYSIVLQGIANTTTDYNDYYVSGTGGMLGKISTLEKSTLPAWKLGTSQDANSLSTNPGLTSAGSTTALDYYTSASLPAVSGTGITIDYTDNVRGPNPQMGALEVTNYIWQGGVSTDFATAGNWSTGVVPPDGADIFFASDPDRNCVLDQNRTLGDITNAQSTDKLVLNGKQLTITENLIFTNGAQIDATETSSIALFGGTTAQNIPSGSFVSNTIDGLTINNINGLTLNGNLTVTQALILTNGAFTLGANSLTLNGAINTTSGALTGGSSTNIVMSGSSASTTLPAVSLNNLTLNRVNGITLGGSVNVAGTLVLTNGNLILGANTITISGNSPTRTSGTIDASNASATIIFTNSSAITLPTSILSSAVNNLTINGTGGITASSDFTVNGVLNLQSANPTATKGILDMLDGSVSKILTMGINATTIGQGDVTGIVTRTSFVLNVPYSFGNQYTSINFTVGPLPTSVSLKIVLTPTHIWRSTAIQRYYDIIRTGSDVATRLILNLHYLDAELNGLSETNLDFFDYHANITTSHDHGHSNQNTSENWLGLNNLGLTFLGSDTWDAHYWTLDANQTAGICTWIGGSPSGQTDWTIPGNWSGGVPGSNSPVIIPDVTYDPTLPASTTIGSIAIQAGGVVNAPAGTPTLTITGALHTWENLGTFNAATSTIVFTNAEATESGSTNFYNVTVADGANLSLGTDNFMRIAGSLSLSNSGILNAANTHNTIEFNGAGNQTVIYPNGATNGFHNLILSNSGTKTLPAAPMSILGDFTVASIATAIAGSSMTIGGELIIEAGSTFATGAFNHIVSGDFDNNGTFTASTGYTITLNGATGQSVYGTSSTTFDNLTINNSNGVTQLSNVNVNNTLTLTAGNLIVDATTLGINGTISKISGYIEVSPLSSLSFGGTDALTISNDLFTNEPIINNLTINRSGGVSLGNQNMTINGLLDLQSGTLDIASDTLTIAGISPTRTIGNIDADKATATLIFTNTDPITLPASIFTGNVNNLTINAIGGITASSTFTINGILNLQSVNPTATKGCLDMATNTLDMGVNATTLGEGDVTGIIRRSSFNPGVFYTYGSQFMTAYFPNEGTLPTEMSARVSIGVAPSWRTGAINREIEIIQTGGSNTKGTFSYHYLDSELNGNDEDHLVFWVGLPTNYEYGRSAYSTTDNWVSLSNVNVAFFSSSWSGTKNITLDQFSNTSTLTWNGSFSDSWTSVENWTPNSGPSSISYIIIPDASTTINSPTLPDFTEIKSLTLEAAAILNSGANSQLTLNGTNACMNFGGNFNPGTSTVIFTNADATISGTTNFNNVTINTGASLRQTSGSVMRIAGAMNNMGTWHAVMVGETTTTEYNGGNQTVVVPNPLTNRYSTLILSGSGTKTLPVSNLSIVGNFSMESTAEATLTSTLTVDGNLSIANGSKLSISPIGRLSVSGNLSNYGSAGSFILESNITGTASLIHSTPNVEATIERYITGNQWHFMYAPLSSIPTATYTVEGAYTNYNLYSYNEITDDYWNNTTTFGTTGWTAEYLNTNLPSSKGYIYNRYGMSDKIFSQTGGSLFVGQKNFAVSYTTNTGTIGNGVLQTWPTFDGWNLVGNPYASAIDWDLVTDKSDIEAGAYFYDGDNYKYYIYGGGSSIWDVGITLNGGSRYIPAGQAFFVKVKNTGSTHTGTLSIPDNARVHNTRPFYKSTKVTVPNILKLRISSENATDETVIRTVPTATDGYDGNFDANKMFSWNKTWPQMYSFNSLNNNFAINAMSEIKESKLVPLAIYAGTTGEYTIDIKENSFNEYFIWLEDKLLGVKQNISLKKSYKFNLGTGSTSNRFLLQFRLNHAPTSKELTNQVLYINKTLSYSFAQNTFADADSADVITLDAKLSDGSNLPPWLHFDASANKFYGVPDKKQTIEVVVTASDLLGKSVSSTFKIEVLRLNHAPIALSIPNQSTYINDKFNFYIPANTFTDTDLDDKLTYIAVLSDGSPLPGWLVFDSGSGRFYGSPGDVQIIEVRITATDIESVSANSTFKIEVFETALSIEYLDLNSMVIYPNPSTGVFNVKTNGLLKSQLIISDIVGKAVLLKELSSDIETVNLTNASKGIYLIQIQSVKGIIRKKIEIQ